MLNRYLGNKKDLLDPLMKMIGGLAPPGGRVCDIFSGTLAVSFELKRRGYSVIANDINLFSAVYAQAFLLPRALPIVELEAFVPRARLAVLREAARASVARLEGTSGFAFLSHAAERRRYVELVALLEHLATIRMRDLPARERRTHFFDTYCEAGRSSAFVSSRGTRGRRRFFTGANAKRIDVVLNAIRGWHRGGVTAPELHALLLCVLLEAMERVANTQGTYHDFPRDAYDPRALNAIRLAPPPLDLLLRGGEHFAGQAEDSLTFIRRAPEHDVLYIDPPYNFRQYTSYYFLPNLTCAYPDLEDPDAYFAGVEFVRGQNMASDFDSPFCSKVRFLESLEALVDRAQARWIVLSYFDGRNHWNDFKREAAGVGYAEMRRFFESTLFARQSLEIVPVPRLNYQSYGGYRAKTVSEYIFAARKAGAVASAAGATW